MKRDLGAHPIQLTTLLSGVVDGGVLLPEFQRSFDWTTSNVRSLLATVLMGWPAGSLLLMDGEPQFALRTLEGAPPRSPHVEYVVLDGQQRLTALFHALRGYGDDVWILDTSDLGRPFASVSVDRLEDAIRPIRRETWEGDYSLERQGRNRLVPLATLASPTDYFEWRDIVVEASLSDVRTELRSHLTQVYKELLSRVHDYAFPAVILQAGLEMEAIARIFERINRTGLRLTTFDLMVARTYTPTWNLRDEWEKALVDLPILSDFTNDGLPALQVVSLLEQEDIRQPAVLNSAPGQVRAEFRRSCGALAAGYEWLIDKCGVRRPDWVPYSVMPIVVGALAADGLLEAKTKELQQWFWLSVMSQRFDVGSSTQAASDYKAMRDGDDIVFSSMRDRTLTVSRASLLDATRRKMGPFWRGFLCATAYGDVLDPLTGEALASEKEGLLVERTDVGSVFPRGGSVAGRSPAHLVVLSSFLARRSTLKLLAGKPANWSRSRLHAAALESQLLPPADDLEALLLDSSAFTMDRLERLQDFLSARAGVTVVAV